MTQDGVVNNFEEIREAFLAGPTLSEGDAAELSCDLTREVCRAYDRRLVTKRSYPQDKKPTESRDAEPGGDVQTEDCVLVEDHHRPAFERDHQWLAWKEDDGLTPARIRDRWNMMSNAEREQVCPAASNKIGNGEPARDVVKKGLTKAKAEKDSDQS